MKRFDPISRPVRLSHVQTKVESLRKCTQFYQIPMHESTKFNRADVEES
jgi:hypothetical protein